MSLARERGLDFGTDVTFTYGPLGFLAVPPMITRAGAIGTLLYTLVLHTAVAATALWSLRRPLGWVAAGGVAYLLCIVAGVVGSEAVIPIVLVWCVATVRGDVPDRLSIVVLSSLGAVAGVHLLVKFSVGIIAGGLVAVSALLAVRRAPLQRRLRLVGAAGGAALLAMLAGWVISGNAVTALPRHLAHSLAIASGYGAAMGIEDPTRPGEYAFAVLALAALVVAMLGSWPRRRVAVAVLTAVAMFGLFKAGFVRHDMHSGIFFAGVSLAALAFPPRPGREAAHVLSIGTTALLLFVTLGTLPVALARPWKSVPAFVDRVAIVASPARAQATIEASKAHLRAAYQLDETTLSLLRDHTVHVHPWETSVVWAYDLPWKPAPVFQSYSAYSPSLDGRNAEVLASESGPERILAEVPLAIDGRLPDWEQPQTTLAMICHYEELHTGERWQVLGKVPDRCGDERQLATVETDGGEVSVPSSELPADSAVVVARVHADGPGLLSRLVDLLYKSPPAVAEVPGEYDPRVIRRNLEGPLLVRSAPALGYSGPFVRADIGSLGFDLDSDGEGDDVRIEFFEIPIEN